MQTLAILSRNTKQGVSVWRFIQTEDGNFFAFGGCKPACKQFKTLQELRNCYKSWLRYGYEPGLVPVKSQLPADLQADLWALPTVA